MHVCMCVFVYMCVDVGVRTFAFKCTNVCVSVCDASKLTYFQNGNKSKN